MIMTYNGDSDGNVQARLPNLRRLFVESRTEAEESSYSRNAVWPTKFL